MKYQRKARFSLYFRDAAYLRAQLKVTKSRAQNKETRFFFCRDGVTSPSLTAKLRKKVDLGKQFWRINATKCIDKGISRKNEAIQSEVLVNNRKPNLYEFGMMKAINAGIDVRHCGICDKHRRCILNYTEEVVDKKTGVKRMVPRQICMHQIPDNRIDKVAQASGCKNYAHNRFFVYQILNNLRNLPCWEWKKG